jgi:hydroxyquinol 1,2-dioxygenase
MRNLNRHNITEAVLARFADTPNPRLREIMTSSVPHLHDFAREVKLTEEEWEQGIGFLTATGRWCNDKPAGCTEATVFGSFYVEGAPEYEHGDDVANGAAGDPCDVNITVRGLDGKAVAGALVDVWQADADGHYDAQRPELGHAENRGQLRTDADGILHFQSVQPVAYPIPNDGAVGDLLRATERHPWRPAHLHFMIQAQDYERLITYVFREGDEWLDSDSVFAVRESLMAPWTQHENGRWRLDFDFVLAPLAPSAA